MLNRVCEIVQFNSRLLLSLEGTAGKVYNICWSSEWTNEWFNLKLSGLSLYDNSSPFVKGFLRLFASFSSLFNSPPNALLSHKPLEEASDRPTRHCLKFCGPSSLRSSVVGGVVHNSFTRSCSTELKAIRIEQQATVCLSPMTHVRLRHFSGALWDFWTSPHV